MKKTGSIFINYRRADAEAWAGRLYDRLTARFGADAIFMDVEHIPVGCDFVEYIGEQVGACSIFLSLIGEKWLYIADEDGLGRRIDNPEDFVRLEIAAALQRGIPVAPVMLGDTPIPRAQELPEPLKPLTRRNALRLKHESFNADVDRLISQIEQILGAEAARMDQRDQARRDAQAGEARRRQEAEAAQRRQAEAETRQREAQARATQRQRAEDAWSKLKTSSDAAEFERFLKAYPDSPSARDAKAKLSALKAVEDVGAKLGRRAALLALLGAPAVLGGGVYLVAQDRIDAWAFDSSVRSMDGAIRGLWNVATTPDAKTVVAAGFGNRVNIWDGDTGLRRAHVKFGREITGLAISPDGARALAGGFGARLMLVDVRRGKLIKEFHGHTKSIWDVAMSRDGRYGVSVGTDRKIGLWDLQAQQQLWMNETEKAYLMQAVAITPDTRLAWVGCRRGSIEIWNLRTGERERRIQAHRDDSNIECVALSKRGDWALAGANNGKIALLDARTQKRSRNIEGHDRSVKAVTFIDDTRAATAGRQESVIKIWDLSTGQEIQRLYGHRGTVSSLAYAPQSGLLFSAGQNDRLVKAWRV